MIQPAQIVEVRSPITGTLHQLNVKAGSTIKKGQVLAQIEANVEKSATQTAYYRTQVKGNVATAQAKITHAAKKADLNRRTIYSPFNGVVMQQYIYTGSMVGPTEGKNPIFKIAQTDQFKINAIVPLKYFRSLKKDQSVKIVPEAPFEKLSTTVKLNHVDQVIDASSGTFSVGAIIQSNSVKFPSGIRCKMYI
jgi:multidrug efflux pump subunit AcrA (membrane-fusion protein)